jgi:hypothetical protein
MAGNTDETSWKLLDVGVVASNTSTDETRSRSAIHAVPTATKFEAMMHAFGAPVEPDV